MVWPGAVQIGREESRGKGSCSRGRKMSPVMLALPPSPHPPPPPVWTSPSPWRPFPYFPGWAGGGTSPAFAPPGAPLPPPLLLFLFHSSVLPLLETHPCRPHAGPPLTKQGYFSLAPLPLPHSGPASHSVIPPVSIKHLLWARISLGTGARLWAKSHSVPGPMLSSFSGGETTR